MIPYISHHAHTNTMSFGGHNLLSLVLSIYASVREYSLEYEKPSSGRILKNYRFPLPWQISIVSSSSVCGRAWRSSTPSALKFWLTSSCMGLLQVKHSCCECSHGMSRDQHFTAPLLILIHKAKQSQI